jgi:hypothetical protein
MTQPTVFRGAGASTLVHPNAPAGGCGPGRSRGVGMMNGPAGSVPHVGSPAARTTNWAATLHARESPYLVVGRFQQRVAAAKNLQELLKVATDIAQAREELVRGKAITRPEAGDKPVYDAVTSILTDKMSALQKIAFAATTELVAAGESAAVAKACAEAFSEAVDAAVEAWVGKFANELRGAIKEGDVTGVIKASAAAVEDLAAGLKDGNSLLRKTLQLLKARNVNVGEAALGKWVFARMESFGAVAGQIVKLWTAHPLVIIARLMLTPSNVASDSEEVFLMYKDLGDQLQARLREFAPPIAPVRATDLIRTNLPASGPVLRPAP